MNNTNKAIKYLSNCNPNKLVFWAVLINLVKSIALIIAGVYDEFFNTTTYSISALRLNTIINLIINFIIITPVLETFVFQYIIIKLTTKYEKKTYIYSIIISSIIFAIFHTHVQGDMFFIYLIDKWIGGIVLATLFIVLETAGKSGFLYTATAHAIINSILFTYTILSLITL